ncbi:MAG TPA: isoleucine--tRNA ligase [Patescibacteria group bacterium]|nr:isoleucine--tRNA ligase [Patescibacteria group bacterium]
MSEKSKENKNIFAEFENQVLDFWNENDIFKKSVNKEAVNGDYVFYDGPPFATGTPHYGHIVGSIMKDVVPRFWTMQGYRVERRWGWDCHGLPIENIVEKEMGTESKKDIVDTGIEKFNLSCQTKVLKYADEWRKVIDKLGRWAEMDSSYKTMDLDYMESVWWVFKTLWEKDLIYKGYRSMHVCPRCETTLSQSEVTEGYKDIKDLSVTAKFKIKDQDNTFLLAWTTTPWTLIANVALAVGEDIEYVKVEYEDDYYILAKERLEEVFKDKDYKIEELLYAKDLVGLDYEPVFYYYQNADIKNIENAFKIQSADFVNTEEGTGIVHIAPAFGEDDLNLGKEKNLPFVQHIDIGGRFKEEVHDFQDMSVKPKSDHMATDIEIVKYLAHHDRLFSKEKYEHSYPHCWRCETPLINYATSSYFVSVEKIKEDLLKKAQEINWSPEHIKRGRFGKWLEGARDWSISRQRFWAAVLPVWKCDTCENTKVFGGVKDLEEASGEKVEDLHKHTLDKIEIKCDCGGTMKRIEDVFDCWFESGSMPYAQKHYPFENKAKFEGNFPAEFIAEGADQTRAWFYYLHVLSTAIMDRPAFKNVIVNGIVLAEDGKKMSKRLQNYPDPMEVIEKYSADALRYYLLCSPVMQAETINFSEADVLQSFRKTSMLVWNVYKFYDMYREKEVETISESDNVLDNWILARLQQTTAEIEDNMKKYDLVRASKPIAIFIDDLSTWYLRRSRDRLKGEDRQEKLKALSTLKTVFEKLSLTMAPFMPFMAETMWQKINDYNFKDENKSVHLESWPEIKEINTDIISKMELVKEIVEKGLAQRDENKLKVRQPLQKATVVFKEDLALAEDYFALIKDELNIKELSFELDKEKENIEVVLDTNLSPDLIEEGMKREIIRVINNLRKNSGLTIEDRVVVYYSSLEPEFAAAINKYQEDIEREVLADKITKLETEVETEIKKQININNKSINIGLEKIK